MPPKKKGTIQTGRGKKTKKPTGRDKPAGSGGQGTSKGACVNGEVPELTGDSVGAQQETRKRKQSPITKDGQAERRANKQARADSGIMLLFEIQCVGQVQGIMFNLKDGTLVVRDCDPQGKVKVYSREGGKVQQMGSELRPPTGDVDPFLNRSGIDLDTQRDLYLLPCNDGIMVRMGIDGVVKDEAKLGENLCGVAYYPDAYFVCDCSQEKPPAVAYVMPQQMYVFPAKKLGRKGIHKTKFQKPYHICADRYFGNGSVVASDWARNMVYRYNTPSVPDESYGPDTDPVLGRLAGPAGVALDNKNYLLVCDSHNSRVLRMREEEHGGLRWECVLDEGQLGGQPWALAVDCGSKEKTVSVFQKIEITVEKRPERLAVSVENIVKVFTYPPHV